MSVIQSYTINPVPKWNKLRQKDGTAPIWICLYIDKKQSFRKTSYRVTRNQWQEKPWAVINHPNATIINTSLKSMCAEIEKEIIGQNLQGKAVSRRILKVSYSNVTLSKYAKEVRGDCRTTITELTRIENFFGYDPLITDITPEFLRKFLAHEKNRGMEATTIHGTFKFLRRICNQATTEGIFQESPMKGFLMPKYVQPDVTWLTEEEKALLQKLIDKTLWPAKDTSKTAMDMCIVAVYFTTACFTGLRYSDWHKTGQLALISTDSDNLFLRATKNKEHVSLPVGKTLRKLLNLLNQLPPVPSLEKCNELLKVIGTLAGFKKVLSTHVGRHSFGTMCANLKIPRDVTAELMGISIEVVAVYYHITGAAIEAQASKLRAV